MDAIYEVGGELDLVITLEDNQAAQKSGRVYLDEFCDINNITLHKSRHINNNDCVEAIKRHKIDWLFIIGWSQIADTSVLDAPCRGVLGIHPTLLPIGRGRAAIPWAILKDLPETGVTLFKLDKGVDTGDILQQRVIPLTKTATATELYDQVNEAHVELIKGIFPRLEGDQVKLKKQEDSLATEWPGRGPEDGEIDLKGSVLEAERLIRAVTRPYPGAFFVQNGKKTIVWRAQNIHKKVSSTDDFLLVFHDGSLLLIDYEESN